MSITKLHEQSYLAMENKIEQRKALNLLGLARKAGKLTTGQDLVLAAIRSGKAKVVLMANDCGQSTQKKFTDKCKSYDVALTTEFTKQELSRDRRKAFLDRSYRSWFWEEDTPASFS